jgi:hypothetical protein
MLTNEDTPDLVGRESTVANAGCNTLVARRERVLEAGNSNKSNQGTGQLAETLHGEHGSHHGASPFRRREFGGDNGRERVVTTDS